MADRQEVLDYISRLGEHRTVTEKELVGAFRHGAGSVLDEDYGLNKHVGVADVLYYVGGAIVFIGIAVLISQNWDSFASPVRIMTTLGFGLAAYVAGVLLGKYKKLEGVAQAFYLISALVVPTGLGVTFHEYGIDVGDFSIQSSIAGILLAAYLLSYYAFRKAIFIIFAVIFGTWLFFSLTSWMVGGRPSFAQLEFYEYRVLLIGLTYILLGYSFVQSKLKSLTGWLYSFGSLGFLGAALALGGWTPEQNVFWEVVYPVFSLGAMFVSIYLKSKSFLIFGAIFLMAYLLKITVEYFTDTLGWPLALVLVGFALIGIGFGTFYMNKKYLTRKLT